PSRPSTPSSASSRRGSRAPRRSGARSWPTSRRRGRDVMATASHDEDELITGINVTPLVDITLVLLVILMVTASYVASKAIPLDLPKGATAEATPTTL